MKDKILKGETALGIELGSTVIKAVLVDDKNSVIATGTHNWENKLENGYWTYHIEEIFSGLASCYGNLKSNVKEKYGVDIKTFGTIGISGMMHGYILLDENMQLLTPFRTWRNVTAKGAGEKLSEIFGFTIPARWSVSHLYQDILDGKDYLAKAKYITTLSGFIHYHLTGEKVLGIGDASGMFPTDPKTKTYTAKYADQMNEIFAKSGLLYTLQEIFPKVMVAGEHAGNLTKSGALLLDKTGELEAGIAMCPPEGDAGTGMVATCSVSPAECNISCGTSIFAMMVLEESLEKAYPDIDIVATPSGDSVAMVHCNNCSSELNAWVKLIGESIELFGGNADGIYTKLFEHSLSADDDCGGIVAYNYTSGEHMTKVQNGCPMVVRDSSAVFNLANFMRAQLYSTFATLRMGIEMLKENENVKINSIFAHGGIFKTKNVYQKYLASGLGSCVSVVETSGEGGAFGMALLANFAVSNSDNLGEYLREGVFKTMSVHTLAPEEKIQNGTDEFMAKYKKFLDAEQLCDKLASN